MIGLVYADEGEAQDMLKAVNKKKKSIGEYILDFFIVILFMAQPRAIWSGEAVAASYVHLHLKYIGNCKSGCAHLMRFPFYKSERS